MKARRVRTVNVRNWPFPDALTRCLISRQLCHTFAPTRQTRGRRDGATARFCIEVFDCFNHDNAAKARGGERSETLKSVSGLRHQPPVQRRHMDGGRAGSHLKQMVVQPFDQLAPCPRASMSKRRALAQ